MPIRVIKAYKCLCVFSTCPLIQNISNSTTTIIYLAIMQKKLSSQRDTSFPLIHNASHIFKRPGHHQSPKFILSFTIAGLHIGIVSPYHIFSHAPSHRHCHNHHHATTTLVHTVHLCGHSFSPRNPFLKYEMSKTITKARTMCFNYTQRIILTNLISITIAIAIPRNAV